MAKKGDKNLWEWWNIKFPPAQKAVISRFCRLLAEGVKPTERAIKEAVAKCPAEFKLDLRRHLSDLCGLHPLVDDTPEKLRESVIEKGRQELFKRRRPGRKPKLPRGKGKK